MNRCEHAVRGAGLFHFVMEQLQIDSRCLSTERNGHLAAFRRFCKIDPTRDTVKYGYGWEWGKYHSMDMIVHGGSWVGFNTVVAKLPERNIWFVGFSNTDAISSNTAVVEMADYYLGKEFESV